MEEFILELEKVIKDYEGVRKHYRMSGNARRFENISGQIIGLRLALDLARGVGGK